MKNKIIIIYLITQILIVITISFMGKGSKVVESNNKVNDSIQDNIESNIINDKEKQNITIIDTIKLDNNNIIYYGKNENHPYFVIKNKYNNIVNEITFEKKEGFISSIENNKVFYTIEFTNNKEKTKANYLITSDTIIPYYKKQLTINYSPNTTITPKYLVIHETANHSIGANASAHYRYWSTNPTAKASAHFVVDSKEIYQMLELKNMAWHVGDNKGHSNIVNSNSIGIEICVNDDGDYMVAREYAIKLAIEVMNELNMSIDQLVTHNDASGKNDPVIMFTNNLWNDFVYQVSLGLNN